MQEHLSTLFKNSDMDGKKILDTLDAKGFSQ